MNFDADRLLLLAGVPTNGKRNLTESTRTPRARSESLQEAKLRQIIREEIKGYLAEREEQQMARGVQTQNVSTALGFAGYGFTPNPSRPNRAVSRGAGRTVGFGGPGFM